jgi:hypothetical protein
MRSRHGTSIDIDLTDEITRSMTHQSTEGKQGADIATGTIEEEEKKEPRVLSDTFLRSDSTWSTHGRMGTGMNSENY